MKKGISAQALILVAAAFGTVSLQGCVSRYAKLEEPTSKNQLVCHHTGWGWLGAPLASYNHSQCVEDLQEKGYQIIEGD